MSLALYFGPSLCGRDTRLEANDLSIRTLGQCVILKRSLLVVW